MNALKSYISDEEDSSDEKHSDYRTNWSRSYQRKLIDGQADVNYEEVQMDMSEDSDNSRSGRDSSDSKRPSDRLREDRGKDDYRSSRDDRKEDRSRQDDKPRFKESSDRFRSDKYDRSDRYDRQSSRDDDRQSSRVDDRHSSRDDDRHSSRDDDRHDRSDRYDKQSSKEEDRNGRDGRADRDGDRRDRYREDRYRDRRERRDSRERRSRRSGSRDRDRRSPKYERRRSRSRSRSRSRERFPRGPRRFDRGMGRMNQFDKEDPQRAADPQGQNENGPKDRFFMPGITGRFRDQIEKRKLLWQKKEVPVAAEVPTTSTATTSKTTKVWEATTFAQDTDGKVASKFKRLMGIKTPTPESKPSTTDVLKRQEEMFSSMEAQYEVARTATHTMRGVGLGFGSFQG